MEIKLKVVQSPPESDVTGHLISIDESGATIGRAATNTLALPDPNRYVSSLHAKIQFNGQQFEIIDQSTNGTFLNNLSQALVKGQPRAIAHRDQVLMGPFVLEVEVVGAESSGMGDDSTSITAQLDDTTSLTIPPNDADVGIDELDKWLEPDAPEPEPLPKLKPATSTDEDSLISAGDKELDPLAALGKESAQNSALDINLGIGEGNWNAPEGELPNPGELGGQRMDIPGMIPTDWDKSMVIPSGKKPAQGNELPGLSDSLPEPSQIDSLAHEQSSPAGNDGSLLDLVNTPPEHLKVSAQDHRHGSDADNDLFKADLDPLEGELPARVKNEELSPDATGIHSDPFADFDDHKSTKDIDQPPISEKSKLAFDPSDSLVDKQLSDWMDIPEPGPLPKMRDEGQKNGKNSQAARQSADAEGKIVTSRSGDSLLDPPGFDAEAGSLSELLNSGPSSSKPRKKAPSAKTADQSKPVAKRRTTGQFKVPPAIPGADSLISYKGVPAAAEGLETESQLHDEIPSVDDHSPSATDSRIARQLAEAMGLVGLTDKQLLELVPSVADFVVSAVDGMMGALRARQTIKNEFRMNLTMIQAVENNPLKFSLSKEDAIENLFLKKRQAYLSATESANEAFADIADHQLALFNGIRAAYDELMGQFSPERLEKRFERQRGKSLFGGSGKKWEAYQDFIEELNEDQERTFKHLFGEVFAEQYEKSFENLKANRRKKRLST